jgi:uncharacterized protein (DUF1697 family)
VKTYIQSGNVVFVSAGPVARLEAELEAVLQGEHGLDVPVLVRTASHWESYRSTNPFPIATEREPNRVMLALSKELLTEQAVADLTDRAQADERLALVGTALYIHFPSGFGRSKLTPAVLDRFVGSPVTTRNWRTVVKIGDMLRE